MTSPAHSAKRESNDISIRPQIPRSEVSMKPETTFKLVAGGISLLLGLYYLNIFIHSPRKWFHIACLAILVFAVVQAYNFYLSQVEMEEQMSKIRVSLQEMNAQPVQDTSQLTV
jgi:hypothetical protein